MLRSTQAYPKNNNTPYIVKYLWSDTSTTRQVVLIVVVTFWSPSVPLRPSANPLFVYRIYFQTFLPLNVPFQPFQFYHVSSISHDGIHMYGITGMLQKNTNTLHPAVRSIFCRNSSLQAVCDSTVSISFDSVSMGFHVKYVYTTRR